MKILGTVIVAAICLGLVLAVEDDQSKAGKKDNSSNDNKTAKDPADEGNKEPHPLCSSCTCDAAKRTFKCTAMNMYKLFNTSDWATLKDSGVATEIMLLDYNGLSEVPAFPGFDVRVLDLSHNNISTIAKRAFFELSKLEVLDLSYNMLTTKALKPEIFEGNYKPDEYLPMENLKVLRLGYNQLHSLDPDLFEHFPNLEELSLVSNVFKVIDQLSHTAISSVLTLRSLDLSYMELLDLPEFMFNPHRELQYLNLTGNLFTKLPEALALAENLKWISLDENPIENIQGENIFPALLKLEYLSLSYITPLKVIGRGAFSKLENLAEVHISNNPEFTYFHADAFSRPNADEPTRTEWPRVKRMYLHNNNLSSLDSSLLARWDDMEVVDIRQNPWICDCDNQWVIETLLPIVEKTTPKIMNNIVCAYPKQMAGLSMVDLQHKHTQLRCKDKYGNNPQNDGALLIGLLFGILAGIPLTAAVILIYRRGCFGLVRRGPADYSRAFYSRTTSDDF